MHWFDLADMEVPAWPPSACAGPLKSRRIDDARQRAEIESTSGRTAGLLTILNHLRGDPWSFDLQHSPTAGSL